MGDHFDLPPGFRFHPTDDELISYYLYNKALDPSFSARAIGDVDLNKSEPWELPWKAKHTGEKEWYFFCVRDRKYPTGLRTNRATESGYWKATGKDKDILKGNSLVGMKKTLVFYKGRAPKGEKTNWVMHEYRLDGKLSLPKTAKNDWVICRVFEKSGKKLEEFRPPPLAQPAPSDQSHVPCFSNPTRFPFSSPNFPNFPHSVNVLHPEQSILRALLENRDDKLNECFMRTATSKANEVSGEISSFDDRGGVPDDLDSFWNFPN